MVPSKKLHELIHSLTKAEKRSFKLLYSSHFNGDDKIFIRLFDFIDQMKEYDEEKIKSHFSGQVFLKQLTATKYYLYNTILKSLSYTKSINAANIQIGNIQSVAVLFDKKLYHHILSILKSVKQKAYEIEHYSVVLECLKWEQKTINHLPLFRNAYIDQHRLSKEKDEVIKQLHNQLFYQSLKSEIYALIKGERFYVAGDLFEQFKKSFRDVVEANPPLGSASKIDYYYISATLQFYNSNFQESKKNYRSLLHLLESNNFLTKEPHNINYLISVQNYLVSSIEASSFGDYEAKLIHSLKSEYKDRRDNYMMIVRMELMHYVRTENFKLAAELIETHKSDEDALFKNDFYVINGYLFDSMLTYFWTGDYRPAIKIINRFTTFNLHSNLPFDFVMTIRLIEILVHYKTKKASLVNQLVKALIRKNMQQKSGLILNQDLLKLLPKILNASSKEKSKKLKEAFSVEMNSNRTEQMNEKLRNYFDFKKWMEVNL